MEPQSTPKPNQPSLSKPPSSPPPSDPTAPADPLPSKPQKSKLSLILAGFLFILLVAVASYFLGRSDTITQLLHKTQPPPSSIPSSPTPAPPPAGGSAIHDWLTYSDSNFEFQYPPDVTLNHQDESIHLNEWGPTQRPETELFDGLSLNFTLKQLSGQTLVQYIDGQIAEEKDMGFMEITDNKQPITIGPYSGFTYTITGLGTHQYIFIQKPNSDSFIEIIDSTVDPTNQGFATLIDQILSTFEFTEESPTSNKNKVKCPDTRPQACTMECVVNPPYICGSDGKSYCTTCQACVNPNVAWYVIQPNPCTN